MIKLSLSISIYIKVFIYRVEGASIYCIFSKLIRIRIEYSVFGDFLNEKKLVCDSNPHPSFDRRLPTGRLIEYYRMLPMC
jgi:hypothetical protein